MKTDSKPTAVSNAAGTRRIWALVLTAALTTTAFTAVGTPAHAEDTNYCDPQSGASPGDDPQGALQDGAKALYGPALEQWGALLHIPQDLACAAGSLLLNKGAETVVLDGAGRAVLGRDATGIEGSVYKQVFEHAVNDALDEQGDGAAENFLAVPVGPQEGSEAPAALYTVSDYWLGGTWGKSDTSDPTWHTQSSQPETGRLWYINQQPVGIVCAVPGSTYDVKFSGHIEQWSWWLRTEDQTLVPAAAFADVSSNEQPSVPLC
jgi:hypothetical protein